MRCFSCDDLLSVPLKDYQDPVLDRCYCLECKTTIREYEEMLKPEPTPNPDSLLEPGEVETLEEESFVDDDKYFVGQAPRHLLPHYDTDYQGFTEEDLES